MTATTAVVGLALVGTACGSSSSNASGGSPTTGGSGGGGGSSSTIPNQKYAENSSGTPVKGGTLTMLGTGDVDYMDPNVTYYTTGYLAMRMISRQLYTYPAVHGQTTNVVADLATGAPNISADGKTYKITLRQGVMWDTTPPRAVTAADAVRGFKRTCNPTQPFGGEPDYSNLIVGYNDFCTAFGKVSQTDAGAQKAFVEGNQISGVSVDPSDPQTLVVQLTKPTSYFKDLLALPAFSPAPIESLSYLPASNDFAQHTYSDGPYKIASYDPNKTIDFVRNDVWNPSTDPIRKAYVNEVKVNETGSQSTITQEITTNTPAADMFWDADPPSNDIPSLEANPNSNLGLNTELSTNPYVLFNTQSPNNSGALGKAAVRQAIAYALNRTNMIQDLGGPNVSPPLTHILPPGIDGSTPNFDPYPNDPGKAKTMLQTAGVPNLTLKFLYRSASSSSQRVFQTVQADLQKVGITVTPVGVPNADFYTKYLQVPSVAKQGTWDLALSSWGPDWYGDAAASFFSPLLDGRVLPPTSSNFGLFNDDKLNTLIDQALNATSTAQAAPIWHQADQEAMAQMAFFPITDPNWATLHGSRVHNAIFIPAFQQLDPTNVWLQG